MKHKFLLEFIKNRNYKLAHELLNKYDESLCADHFEITFDVKKFYTWLKIDNSLAAYKYDDEGNKVTFIISTKHKNILHLTTLLLLIYSKLLEPVTFGNMHMFYYSEMNDLKLLITKIIKLIPIDLINQSDAEGNNPLHYISKTQYTDIAELLIDKGINRYMINRYNKDCVNIAKEIYENVIDILPDPFDSEKFLYEKMIKFLEKNKVKVTIDIDLSNISDSGKCIVCLTETRNILIYPCKHLSMCEKCHLDSYNKQSICVICRSHVVSFTKIYMV